MFVGAYFNKFTYLCCSVIGVQLNRCFLFLKKEADPASETSCFIQTLSDEQSPEDDHVSKLIVGWL